MPRRSQASTSAVQPSKGRKTTFGDDDDDVVEDVPQRDLPAEPDVEDSEDEDDAPEAVGTSASKIAEDEARQRKENADLAKRQAARIRLQKIQAIKLAQKKKGKQPMQQPETDTGDSDDDDAETRRLKARMARAMDEGSGDSEASLHTDSDEGSFHTDDSDEDEPEDDSEHVSDDSDSSETLHEGPLSANDIKMRALMDQAMAAADRRAGIAQPKTKSQSKGKAKATEATQAAEAVDEEAMWDMTPGFGPKPLSTAVLAAAEKAETEAALQKQRKKEEAMARREAEERAGRKKQKYKRAQNDTKRLKNGTIVQLLPPRHEETSSLPPMVGPSRPSKASSSSSSRDKFLRTAMKRSGQMPGSSPLNGRKRIIMRPS
ncbi:hypothetical protein BD324DRAFT_611634 [Kockovaella imperatae]|uniref:U3 snoRNA associated-domain-containing protein n=1 Tax=Kockovaella imperatae TaxID=4999 RepID=A0A1Y1URP9_9TREE|nr:hypothetical protein BD324DRAFT_611634 [Kockovaella imperatae]ORX40649.1 hypothetical protein BD324DRAFT_611634 [Kockovaella imperatae]